MTTMGMLKDDERGHLIARELGGDQSFLNVVPMARGVNRHTSQGTSDSVEPNLSVNPLGLPLKQNLYDMGYPLSVWRKNEQFIRDFLDKNPGGFVDYTVVVQYPDVVVSAQIASDLGEVIIQNGDLRPTHFMQQFTLYFPDGNVERYAAYVFINDNDFQCPNYEQSLEDDE